MNVTGEWLEKWSAVFLMWTASLVKHNKKHKNFWCTGQQTDEKMTAEVLQEILQLFEGRRNHSQVLRLTYDAMCGTNHLVVSCPGCSQPPPLSPLERSSGPTEHCHSAHA